MPGVTDTEVGLTQKLLRDVEEKLKERMHATLHSGIRKQRLAARMGGQRVGGAFESKFQIRPEFYHHWGQRLGYECWEDEQFVREFLRDNPECRVRSRTGRIMVGYAPSGKRFHKNYGTWKSKCGQ